MYEIFMVGCNNINSDRNLQCRNRESYGFTLGDYIVFRDMFIYYAFRFIIIHIKCLFLSLLMEFYFIIL